MFTVRGIQIVRLPKKIELGEHSLEVRPLSLQTALMLKRQLGLPVAPSGYAPLGDDAIYVRDFDGASIALIHELIHKLDHLQGIGLTERQVVKLADGWNALLVANDFSFIRRPTG